MIIEKHTKKIIKSIVFNFPLTEWCGTLKRNSLNKLSINQTTIFKGNTQARGSCSLSFLETDIIWHTHGLKHKSYPSVEDIMKVVVNDEITQSYIFTQWGIWKLEYQYSIKNKSLYKHMENDLNEYSKIIYENANKGIGDYKDEYIDYIRSYIYYIEQMYKNLLKIEFMIYEKI